MNVCQSTNQILIQSSSSSSLSWRNHGFHTRPFMLDSLKIFNRLTHSRKEEVKLLFTVLWQPINYLMPKNSYRRYSKRTALSWNVIVLIIIFMFSWIYIYIYIYISSHEGDAENDFNSYNLYSALFTKMLSNIAINIFQV